MNITNKIKSLFFITALGALVTTTSCKKDHPAPEVPPVVTPTVVGVAQGNANFSILVAAVTKAGLVGTLSDLTKNFTVFAPTNAAFEAAGYPLATINGLSAADVTNVLTPILTYHVLGAKVLSTGVPASDTVKTLNGLNLFASKNVNGVFLNGIKVTIPDLGASNGVVHAIDKLLVPPTRTIAATVIASASAPTPEFSLLLAAVSRAGLAGVLSGPGKYTVFAPTNAAFIAAGAPFNSAATIATADSATVRRIVLSHVIGTNVFASDLTAGGIAPTLNTTPAPGQTLTVSLAPTLGVTITGSPAANLAPIVAASANLVQTNGVIHVVSKVIL